MKLIIPIFWVAISSLSGCEQAKQTQAVPTVINRSHVCALDGMIIKDYPGPKAQLVGRDGEIRFYCDVREAFTVWVDPVEQNRVDAFYVQDFSNVEWGAYTDRWIKADAATYVVDSSKFGAMGVSYVPFSVPEAAQAFEKEHGGRLVRISDISTDVVAKSNDLQRQRLKNPGSRMQEHNH